MIFEVGTDAAELDGASHPPSNLSASEHLQRKQAAHMYPPRNVSSVANALATYEGRRMMWGMGVGRLLLTAIPILAVAAPVKCNFFR
jgi:hypothetical protein